MTIIKEPNNTAEGTAEWVFALYDKDSFVHTGIVPTVLITIAVIAILYGIYSVVYCPCAVQCPCRRRKPYEHWGRIQRRGGERFPYGPKQE